MNVEKLPSGSYRVRKQIDGKRVSMIFDHKPTEREVQREVVEKMKTAKKTVHKQTRMTFRQAADKYCDAKKNVLKPNTYREYMKTCDRLDDWFTEMFIDEIEQIDIDKQINDLSATRSPKTVRNYHAFISAILGTFRPNMVIHTTLPQKRQNKAYMPSESDVKAIIKELEGTMFYIPMILASYGMRRGEICALTVDDIEGDIVHITKSLARDINNNWITDIPKTTESNRDIIIPMKLADMIREQGYVYKGHPNSITEKLYKVQKQLGIPKFSIHKLRHYFASVLSANNVPEADILALGGWNTEHVMKSIYRYSMLDKKEQAKRNAINSITNSLDFNS